MSWKSDFSSTSPHISRSILSIVIFCCGVFCCDVADCQGQVTGVDTGSILDLAATSQTDGPVDSATVRAQFIEFERQLNAILKTRRAEEQEFVGQVVNQIRLGLIPSRLVTTSFKWVRNKRPTTKYPFIYFERVLRLQAERIGLADQVPPFDFSIYSGIPEVITPLASPTLNETPVSDKASTERNGRYDFRPESGLRDDRFGAIGGQSETPTGVAGETERQSSVFKLLNRFIRR